MGKLEKVIVLSVLFVVAVILVVSLTTDNPLDKNNVSILGQPAPKVDPLGGGAPAASTALAQNGAAAVAPTNAQAPGQPGALLSSNVNTAPAAPAAAPIGGIPAGSLLKRLDGLQDSYLPDMKFYTWKSGDSYRGIAEQYYGDWTKFPLLRRANEGRKQVQIGEKVLVPVFDLDPAATANAPGLVAALQSAPAGAGASVPAATTPVAERANTPVKASSKKAPAASGGGKVHVVKEGESLWKIAKLELGNGANWNKIYEANKDIMKSPEALKTGMKLKIP